EHARATLAHVAFDEILPPPGGERGVEASAVARERHAPEVEVRSLDLLAVVHDREALEIGHDYLAAVEVDDARAGRELTRRVRVSGLEHGHRAQPAVGGHLRAARHTGQGQRVSCLEARLEKDRLAGRADTAPGGAST